MNFFNPNKSVLNRISLLAAAGVIFLLSICLIIILLYSEKTKLNNANESIKKIDKLMKESIVFSMSKGVTDVDPFIEKMENTKSIKQFRIIPTEIINKDKSLKLDESERGAINSKEEICFEEKFGSVPVLRSISLIKAVSICANCHGGKEGDVLAVMSIRYSLEETHSAIASERITGILIIIVLALFIWILIVYLLKKYIFNNLLKFIEAITQISIGNFNTEINYKHKDEFGQFAESFKTLKQNLTKQANTVREFANGNFDVEVNVSSEDDQLGKSVQGIKNSLSKLSDDTKTLSISAARGELSTRADTARHNGIFKKIISGFNSTFDCLTAPIKEGSEVLSKYAKGDLSCRVISEFKGEHQQLKNGINNLGDSLSYLIDQITEAVQATVNTANQISSSTEEMAAGAQEQSVQASEVACAVEQMTKTIYETSRNSGQASEASKNAGKAAKEGGRVVEETINGMNRIAGVVRKSAETVQALGKSSNQIGEIVQVIDDIADQTNLLALNAAIEAARAGEQGRGFAVVADEVRKLAERTTKATKEIASMIKQIQKDTGGAVESMQQGTKEAEAGKVLAEKAGESLQEIIHGVELAVDIATQVAAASEEQSSAAEQISKNIESISTVTQQSSSGIHQIALSSENLNNLTLRLQELVAKFKIGETTSVRRLAVRQNGKLIHT